MLPRMNEHTRVSLRPDRDAVRRGVLKSLTRAVVSHLATSKDGYPFDFAQEKWPTDTDAHWLTKAATSPTTTTAAPSLLQTLTADFLSSLGPVSAGAALLDHGIKLSFAGNAVIRVPKIIADDDGAGFIAEGSAIPVRQLTAGSTTLEPRKFATISVFTGELFQHSIPNIEIIVRQVLTESVGLALDAALLGTTAGDTTKPAGLRYGIVALTPSGATPVGQEPMVKDVSALISAVAPVAGNAPIVILASPARAMLLRLRAGATDIPAEILATSALADDELVAIASNALVSATDAVPRFSSSNEALIHMEDASPLPISTAGSPNTVAAPARSLFQTDTAGLRMIMEVSWGLRHASGLAWIDNISAW